jgi:hypothetical protein
MGMRLTADKKIEYAKELLTQAKGKGVDPALAERILANPMSNERGNRSPEGFR